MQYVKLYGFKDYYKKIGFETPTPTIIWCDNQNVIKLFKNQIFHDIRQKIKKE